MKFASRAMKMAPIAVRSVEPSPPWIAVPPTSTAATVSIVKPSKFVVFAWPTCEMTMIPQSAAKPLASTKARIVVVRDPQARGRRRRAVGAGRA